MRVQEGVPHHPPGRWQHWLRRAAAWRPRGWHPSATCLHTESDALAGADLGDCGSSMSCMLDCPVDRQSDGVSESAPGWVRLGATDGGVGNATAISGGAVPSAAMLPTRGADAGVCSMSAGSMLLAGLCCALAAGLTLGGGGGIWLALRREPGSCCMSTARSGVRASSSPPCDGTKSAPQAVSMEIHQFGRTSPVGLGH